MTEAPTLDVYGTAVPLHAVHIRARLIDLAAQVCGVIV